MVSYTVSNDWQSSSPKVLLERYAILTLCILYTFDIDIRRLRVVRTLDGRLGHSEDSSCS